MNTLTIEVYGGLVTDCSNLPDGWGYEVYDIDVEKTEEDYEVPTLTPNTVLITVQGGMVVEVENLPPGYDYEVNDLDLENLDDSDWDD